MKILLGVTGSVAAVLTPKLVKALKELGEVQIILTNCGKKFINGEFLKEFGQNYATVDFNRNIKSCSVYTDDDEWFLVERQGWHKGDKILHIDLANWCDVLVIAPLTANTASKIAYGICDNLLTCTYMALPFKVRVIFAPAMNTNMWRKCDELYMPILRRYDKVIEPQEKELACGEVGVGAMADIKDIVEAVRKIGPKS